MDKKTFANKILAFAICVVATLLITSCIPQRKIILAHDAIPEQSVYAPAEHITDSYLLQPNDYLFINVASPDPELAVVFNPRATSGNSGSSNLRQEFFYYGLNDSLQIYFPLVGKIDLKGCNVSMAREIITKEVAKYLKEFTLTVRLASNNFSIVGEVARQGHYTMSRDQVTIFDAIATAGGFTSYAKRREVKLFRKNELGEMEVHEIDMTKGAFINADYYYIHPNDVIYIRPLWVKMLGFGETLSLSLVSSFSSLITLYLLLQSL